MPRQNQKPSPELQQPGPGRSTAEIAFDQIRREVAQLNEQAHQRTRKLRAAREREQILRRRAEDL